MILEQSELQRFFKEKPSVSIGKIAKESGFNQFTLYALVKNQCTYTDAQAEKLAKKVAPVMERYGFKPQLKQKV